MSTGEASHIPPTPSSTRGPGRALRWCLGLNAIGILLASTSPVGPDPGWMLLLVPFGILSTAWWLFAFIGAMLRVVRGTGARFRLTSLLWLLPLSLPWIALLLSVNMVPAKARFLIARPALDRFTTQLITGTATRPITSERIAGYPVQTVSRVGSGVRFDLVLSLVSEFGMDRAVLIYSPDAPPSRSSIQDRVYNVYHLGGPWYSAWIDF
jgi:hypothetical protein